ncbi:transposase, IS4 family, partial [Oesophagostomum dentatum]
LLRSLALFCSIFLVGVVSSCPSTSLRIFGEIEHGIALYFDEEPIISVPRVFKERKLPFEESSDEAFRKDFRFRKDTFYRICSLVAADMQHDTTRMHALTVRQQVAMCLNLFGQNNKQRDAARLAGCDQATVSRAVPRFADALCAKASRYIYWPTEEERRAISKKIFDSYRLPNVVGFIDGSQVCIQKPTENETDYVNRKNYHSINVGAVCDHQLKFRWVSASFPGSVHDSRVFKESQLYQDLSTGAKRGCLVGDSAYAAESFLIKVVENPQTNKEHRYNKAVCAARSHIERAFGCLKSQWKIIREQCRYEPGLATRIIVACMVLRNIAIDASEADDFSDAEESDDEDDERPPNNLPGRALIRQIINDHFLNVHKL